MNEIIMAAARFVLELAALFFVVLIVALGALLTTTFSPEKIKQEENRFERIKKIFSGSRAGFLSSHREDLRQLKQKRDFIMGTFVVSILIEMSLLALLGALTAGN